MTASLQSKTGSTMEMVDRGQRAAYDNDEDDEHLRRIGRQPVLERTFGFPAILGFSCTVLLSWEGVLLTFGSSYLEAGPSGAFYAYLVVWFGMTCTYLCLAELGSMAPTSAGQYHWVSMLAPRSSQRYLSYMTAWFTLTGWQSSVASGLLNIGLLVQGLISLCNTTYEPKRYVPTLIGWAVLLFAVTINVSTTSSLARFEGLILFLHVIGFLAILIPLTYLAPHVDSSLVVSTFINQAGWSTQSLAFFVGLVGPVYAFIGGDSAMHMAEEIHHAPVVLPYSLLLTIGINGLMGLGMLLAALYSMGPPDQAFANVAMPQLGFPFIQILVDAFHSIPATAIVVSAIVVLGAASTCGLLASTSRILWSISRDRGLPFANTISKVHKQTAIPVVAVLTVSAIAALLDIIAIGSDVAFNNIISITIVGIVSSYLMPITLLLYRRITGGIASSTSGTLINTRGAPLIWGPFRMPHIIGIIVNTVAVSFLFIVFFFAFWPPQTPVTGAASMNFTCLMFGFVFILSNTWYILYAKKHYDGPVIGKLDTSESA